MHDIPYYSIGYNRLWLSMRHWRGRDHRGNGDSDGTNPPIIDILPLHPTVLVDRSHIHAYELTSHRQPKFLFDQPLNWW